MSLTNDESCCVCRAIAHNIAKPCATETAYNAVFTSVLKDFSSGKCLDGYAGSITLPCLYNTTSDEAYWGEPTGACERTPAAARWV